MKKELINTIEQGMLGILNNEQLAKLHEVLEFSFAMFAENYEETQYSNDELLKLFLSAKQVEGCSERSLKYYRTTLSKMNEKINKSVRQIETNDIRTYISNYENETSAGKVTLDNIRRIISSFFAWLEDENYIVKSPARRIHKIRVGKTVKDVYSDEELERMRDSCNNSRDLAIIDILSSTGIRVGDDDDKIRLNQRKPSKYKGLRRFGPEKNLQRINKFMKERPIFYKNLIQMKENFRFYLRCFYCITKVVILQFNSEKQDRISS